MFLSTLRHSVRESWVFDVPLKGATRSRNDSVRESWVFDVPLKGATRFTDHYTEHDC